MKTSPIKFGALSFLILLVACGKPVKEESALPISEDSPEAVQNQTQIQKGLQNNIASDDASGFFHFVNTHSLNIENTKIGEDTVLIAAIKNNSTKLIERLIAKGVNLEETNDNGDTPLMTAISQDTPNDIIISVLLQRSVKLNAKNKDGDSALHIAIKKGHESFARRLIEGGANINITDGNNETSYEIAESMGLAQLAAELLQRIRVTFGTPEEVTFRKVIMDLASKNLALMLKDHPTVAQTFEKINPLGLIIDQAANREVQAKQMIQTLLNGTSKISANGPKGADMPPLVHAAFKNNLILVKTLSVYHPDFKLTDKNGRNALIHAVTHNNPEMVRLVFDNNPESKYKVKRPLDNKKVTFDACDVARDIGKKLPDPKKIKNDLIKAHKAQADIDSIKAIKEKLGCDFWDWLF